MGAYVYDNREIIFPSANQSWGEVTHVCICKEKKLSWIRRIVNKIFKFDGQWEVVYFDEINKMKIV